MFPFPVQHGLPVTLEIMGRQSRADNETVCSSRNGRPSMPARDTMRSTKRPSESKLDRRRKSGRANRKIRICPVIPNQREHQCSTQSTRMMLSCDIDPSADSRDPFEENIHNSIPHSVALCDLALRSPAGQQIPYRG